MLLLMPSYSIEGDDDIKLSANGLVSPAELVRFTQRYILIKE